MQSTLELRPIGEVRMPELRMRPRCRVTALKIALNTLNRPLTRPAPADENAGSGTPSPRGEGMVLIRGWRRKKHCSLDVSKFGNTHSFAVRQP
jgi:hypothetical protein